MIRPSALSILVAEDTPSNQKVIASILKRRGHRVEIAGNGREVLERVRRNPFDVILMDVQMPEIDGYQATGMIRQFEQHATKRTPIIALTAHNTAEDCQRCLQADMDACLTKPIDARVLVEAVERYRNGTLATVAESLELTVGSDAGPAPDGSNSRSDEFDLAAALRRLGSNRAMFRSLVENSCEDAASLLDELHEGIRLADARRVERAAHTLGGLAATFGARSAAETAREVETAARSGVCRAATPAVGRLERQIQSMLQALLTGSQA